jgi:5-methylcytosine-specific restriction enzyme subunit McrC
MKMNSSYNGLNLKGILLSPFNGVEVDEAFSWDVRMKIEVITLNLDHKWKDIYCK